jgi:hypothetical protein
LSKPTYIIAKEKQLAKRRGTIDFISCGGKIIVSICFATATPDW